MKLSPKKIFLLLVSLTTIFGAVLVYHSVTPYGNINDVVTDLASGEYVGFIDSLDMAKSLIEFDVAELLTGKAALAAAIEDGACPRETLTTCIQNDTYIQNSAKEKTLLTLSPTIRVSLLTLTAEATGAVVPSTVSMSQFEELVSAKDARWRDTLYRLQVRDGVVLWIEEVYAP